MKLTAESTVVNDAKINTDIDTAQTSADNAQTSADNAQGTADTAVTKADNAQGTADTAVTKADNAQSTADSAQATANSAKNIADTTAQYFWFTSSGSDTGAHISEKTQEQFVSNPSGGNLLARSNGIAVRDGLTELATFGATSARIGGTSARHVNIATDGLQVYQDANTPMAHLGYGNGTSASGQSTAPYFTLGTRASASVGNFSLTAGKNCTANKEASTAFGTGTTTTNHNQTVVGRYNDPRLGLNSLFVVGDGTSTSNVSTAFHVEQGGDTFMSGYLTVEGHSSHIGTRKTAYLSSNRSITAGTGAYLCSLTLEKGVWVITAVARFQSASDTSYRRLSITTASTGDDPTPNVQVSAINGTPTTLTATIIEYVSPSSGTTETYYLAVLAGKACTMNAGSALAPWNYLRAVRIA